MSGEFARPESFDLWIVGAVTFIMAGIAHGAVHPRSSWISPIGILGGIAVGVAMEAMYQEFVNAKSRNLWPIDIVFWWILALIPVYLGFVVGRLLRKR